MALISPLWQESKTNRFPTSSPHSSPSYKSFAETSTQLPIPFPPYHGIALTARAFPPTPESMRIAVAPLIAFTLLLSAACSHNTIPGTQIRDAPDNRAILDVLAAYKAAMEARDSDALLALAAPTYFDRGDPNRTTTTGPHDFG